MPHNAAIMPYVVLGDGIVPEDAPKRVKKGKHFPVFSYAASFARANEIADNMLPWNETVLICKIEKVIK